MAELEPTEKQLALLEKFGIPAPATRQEASKLLQDEIEHRKTRKYDWHYEQDLKPGDTLLDDEYFDRFDRDS